MAKGKRGRPKKERLPEDDKQPLVRLDPDLVSKLGWIVYLRKKAGEEGYTAGAYVEPLIRGSIQNDYKKIETDVEAIKRLEAKAGQKLKESEREE